MFNLHKKYKKNKQFVYLYFNFNFNFVKSSQIKLNQNSQIRYFNFANFIKQADNQFIYLNFENLLFKNQKRTIKFQLKYFDQQKMRTDLRYLTKVQAEENQSNSTFRATSPFSLGISTHPTHDHLGKSQNYNHQQNIVIEKNALFQKAQNNQIFYSKHSNKYSNSSSSFSLKNNQIQLKLKQSPIDSCQNCKSVKLQKQTIVKFMKEQIQIASKQYKEKMNRILKDQAKQIIQLKGKLQKNHQTIAQITQKAYYHKNFIINDHENTQNLDYSYYPNNKRKNQKIQKVSPLRIDKKSPSKLSLTKSTTSLSISQQKSKTSKISMLSKQLSPAKIIKTNSQIQSNKNTINLNELVKKIKEVQQKLALSFQYQNQRTQKFHLFNKHLQLIETGLLKLFAFKIKNSQKNLQNFMIFQQNKIKMIQQDLIKCIALAKYNYSQKSESFQSTNTANLTNPQMKAFVKNIKIQIQELKQISKQIKTKQFKYDNFQVEELTKFYQNIYEKVMFLQGQKQKMSEKFNILRSESKILKQQKQQKQADIKNDNKKGNVFVCKKFKFQQNRKNINESQPYSSYSLSTSHNLFQNERMKINRKQVLALAVQQNLQHLSKTTTIGPSNYYQTARMNEINKSQYEKDQNQFSIDSFINMSRNKNFNNNSSQNFIENRSYSNISNNNINNNTKSLFNKFNSIQYNNHIDQSPNPNLQQFQYQYPQGQQSILTRFGQNTQVSQISQISQSENNSENQNNSFVNQNNQIYEDGDDEFFYPDYYQNNQNQQQNQQQNEENSQILIENHNQNKDKKNIQRFMDIFNYRKYQENKNIQNNNIRPIHVQIDQTGYVKCSQNGMYIVDRNGDGFQLEENEIKYLLQNGFICI